MRVVYIGNFGPPHSTENHLRRALGKAGHHVRGLQEGPTAFARAPLEARRFRADLVLWTHTHGLAPPPTHPRQLAMVETLRENGVPSVSYHLDRWFGLEREPQVAEEPFFRTDLVCTADGGAPWEDYGVRHVWFPPAVLGVECALGTPRDEYRSEIAFVGSWAPGYHAEWPHRSDLVRWLRDRYGDRVRFWPAPGAHALRGDDLRDLYASVDVLVGDSCLAPYSDGTPAHHYCSDRVPETLGRGGCLIHPTVAGVVGLGDLDLWKTGRDLLDWTAGDWTGLEAGIELLLGAPELRRLLADQGRSTTLERHTYERRMAELEWTLHSEGLLGHEGAAVGPTGVDQNTPSNW